jgi:methionine synthase II (cobalamin-independent)
MMKVQKQIEIEDLVREYPASVGFLRNNGIRCLQCGEPLWGTFEKAAKDKGFSEKEIDELLKKLNEFLDQKS